MDKKTILIAEDEIDMRRLLVLELEAAGYEVKEADDGQIALDIALKEPPDLIISDVLMPNMDGFTFYKHLKRSAITADIPILILTARGKMEDSFKVVGADEFVAKPFIAEDLLVRIKNLLEREPAIEKQEIVNKRVLVAGGDTDTVENMVVQLKKAGCNANSVATGPQIISKVVMFLPQLLIMDVLTDDMAADEIIKVLRQMPQGEKVPIILYSFYRLSDLGSEDVRQRALSVDASVNTCIEVGATEYIGRYNETVFMKAIEKHLKA